MYDAIIVGSSFSGAMTALSMKSQKVLLVEKRKVPGTPVNTTGAVPIEWITKMGVFPSKDCIAGNLRGIELVAPNGESATIKNEQPDGMVLYPDKYVKWLAKKAVDSGSELVTDAVFKGLSVEDGGIKVETSRGTFRGRYVVGADGAASNVGRSAGLGEKPSPEDLHIGMEYTVENDHVQDPEVYRLYLGHKVAPLGYAWSFPEGDTRLKVGLGIPQSTALTAKKLVQRFLDKYPEFKTPISKSNGGIIPTAPPLKTAVKGNVVLVGDAAHFCLLPGQAVMTNPGCVAVEAVGERCEVLTDRGRFRRVERSFVRDYDGPVVRLRAYHLGEQVTATPNHPVLAIKPPRCPANKDEPCYPWHRGAPCRRLWGRGPRPQWWPAGDLAKGDLVAIPIPGRRDGDTKVVLQLRRPSGRHESYTWETDYEDPSLCRLVGYYLAEGSARAPSPKAREGVVTFTFDAEEKGCAKDVGALLRRFFGARPRTYRQGNSLRIVAEDGAAYWFLSRFGSGSNTKALTDEILRLPDGHVRQLLRGYWSGDGHRASGYGFSSVTASRRLAYGIMSLLLRLRFVPSLRSSRSRKGGVAYTLTIGGRQARAFGEVAVRKEAHPPGKTEEGRERARVRAGELHGAFWVPLREASTFQYHGKVYNLKVDEDESYAVNGMVVHNCSPLHGGGIWFGMQSGQLAGIALSRGDPALYDRLWKERLGGVLSRHYKLKQVIYSMTDKNFDDLIGLMKTYVKTMGRKEGMAVKVPSIFFSDPGFILEMALKWSRKGLALDVIKRILIPSFRIA